MTIGMKVHLHRSTITLLFPLALCSETWHRRTRHWKRLNFLFLCHVACSFVFFSCLRGLLAIFCLVTVCTMIPCPVSEEGSENYLPWPCASGCSDRSLHFVISLLIMIDKVCFAQWYWHTREWGNGVFRYGTGSMCFSLWCDMSGLVMLVSILFWIYT